MTASRPAVVHELTLAPAQMRHVGHRVVQHGEHPRLRMCAINPRTTRDDVARTIERMEERC